MYLKIITNIKKVLPKVTNLTMFIYVNELVTIFLFVFLIRTKLKV